MAESKNIEQKNLEAHVELCHQRYESLENRLGAIEKKVETMGFVFLCTIDPIS